MKNKLFHIFTIHNLSRILLSKGDVLLLLRISWNQIRGCFLCKDIRYQKKHNYCIFLIKKKSMCKSLYFLVGKVADCVNFVSALLLEAQSTPFQITPSTMANIVKGLYTLRPGKKGKCLYWFHLVIVICLPKCVYSLTDELLIAKVCCVLCIIMLSSTLVLVAHLVGDLGQGTM